MRLLIRVASAVAIHTAIDDRVCRGERARPAGDDRFENIDQHRDDPTRAGGRVDLVQGPATRGGLPSADCHRRNENRVTKKKLEKRFFRLEHPAEGE